MQRVEQAPALRRASPQQTLQIAWLTLLVAFGLCCALAVTAGYLVWRYHTYATIDPGNTLLIERAPDLAGAEEWVMWRPRSRTIFQQARSEEWLSEGDEVRISTTTGYGQVATIRLFDQSTFDMWSGAGVQLERMQVSRWTNRVQEVTVRQKSGYVRYDLLSGQPYAQVTFTVLVGDARVELKPGGSYSIEVLPPVRRVLVAGAVQSPIVSDVAVRSGLAFVHGADGSTVNLLAGMRVEVDPTGIPSLPVPARWELLRDGNFSAYNEETYNNTTIPAAQAPNRLRSQTWKVYGVPPDAGVSGFFKLFRICRPPDVNGECAKVEQRNAAGFIRNGQTRPFATGVEQNLGPARAGVDISEYRSLVFSAWVRVNYQSIPLTGEQGSECPLMVRFIAKRTLPTDPEQERVLCVYYADPAATQPPMRWPGVQYVEVQQYQWHHLEIELRDPDWLPDYYYLRGIQIYANGHDYDSRVAEVSLVGSLYAPPGGP